MPYNTSRAKMLMREYGRHVQEMVEHVAKIEDPAKRNEQIQIIIEMMGHMNPHLRNVEDFRHKLYDHIYIMADYNIDITSPYPIPQREIIERKPDPLPYPKHKMAFRHYGKNIERMIEKAKSFEEEEKQQAYLQYLANYMKLVHANWNKENVNDELIRQDLKTMSRGQLELSPESELQQFKAARPFREDDRGGRSNGRHQKSKSSSNNRNQKFGRNNNNNNRNFKRNK